MHLGWVETVVILGLGISWIFFFWVVKFVSKQIVKRKITFCTARHQTMAGNEINAEHSHKHRMNKDALFGVIRDE